jgi:hypothetical protein
MGSTLMKAWKRNPVTSNYTNEELIIGGVVIIGGLLAINALGKTLNQGICNLAHAPGTALCSIGTGAGQGIKNFFSALCPFGCSTSGN